MRHFSEEEKVFINEIVRSEGGDVRLMSLLLPYFNKDKVGLLWDQGGNKVLLQCFREDKQNEDKYRSIQRMIARVGNLIRYLEEGGYLITITPSNVETKSRSYGDIYAETKLVPSAPWILPDARRGIGGTE